MTQDTPTMIQVDPSTPFADEVRALAEANADLGTAEDAVVFYGSSSIRLWETLETDFTGQRVINRGFGGSTLTDCARELERLVVPLRPRALVLYAGDNDLANGDSPEHVLWVFENMVRSVRARLGGLPLLLIAIKPSPVRFWNHHQIQRANHLLRETSERLGVRFVDLYAPMLNEHGAPRRELFDHDGLHMTRPGYELWAAALRAVLPGEGGQP